MQINVENYLKSDVKLRSNNAMLVLYEAISNSIFAKAKNIIIEIEHERQLTLKNESQNTLEVNENKIKNIKIIDDGMGFITENYNSFNSAYDSNKKSGKGKGRFFFLKAFNSVEVKSTFYEDGNFQERKFKFLASKEGIENHSLEIMNNITNIETEVFLKGLRKECLIPNETSKISNSILIHFLLEFYYNKTINIFLKDEENNISLRDEFNNNILNNLKKINFTLKEKEFELIYIIHPFTNISTKSKIIFTGEKRAVIEENLEEYNKDFGTKFENGLILSYVSSEYLDEKINADRNDFDFSLQLKLGSKFNNDLTTKEIGVVVTQKLEEELEVYLQKIKEIKEKKMDEYFQKTVNLSDKVIFDKFKKEILEQISGNEREGTLEKIFDEKRRAIKKETAEEVKNIVFEMEDYKEKVKKLTEKIDIGLQMALVDYVIQRKAILDIYFEMLKGKEKFKKTKTGVKKEFDFSLESEIHNLLFPMKETNEAVDYENHNLWLIDDALAFQSFISSDLEIKTFTKDDEDTDRPDLLFFSDYDPDEILDSLTIVEVKRPEVNVQGREEPPHEQVMRYVKKLRERELNLDGKVINTNKNTRFYCYILLDLNNKNEEIFIDNNYTPLRENKGYIYYHPLYKMHVTVIDYRQMGKDALRRNKAFFEKLGINCNK